MSMRKRRREPSPLSEDWETDLTCPRKKILCNPRGVHSHYEGILYTKQRPKAAAYCMTLEGGIYYLTPRGRVLSTSYPVKTPTYAGSRPRLINVTGCQSIASNLNYTYILQRNGNYFKVKWKKFENQSTKGLIQNPTDIACDSDDNVYIADGRTRSVFVFRNEILVRRLTLLPLHNPLHLAVPPTVPLIFISDGSTSIQVYDKHTGHWLYTVRARGKVTSISVLDEMLLLSCSSGVGQDRTIYSTNHLPESPFHVLGTFLNASVFSSTRSVGITTYGNSGPARIITKGLAQAPALLRA